MPLPVSRIVATLALSCIAACSAQLASPIPEGDGELAGGAKGGGPTSAPPDAGASPAPSPPPSGSSGSSGGSAPGDAAVPPVTFEAGPPVYPDAGEVDAGAPPPPITAAGTCATPACATLGNACGCQATNPNGDVVQMGCQAGGECVCLVNQQQTTAPPFDEDGACSDQFSTAAQFVMNCQCQ